jgi:glycosyltransferase involved in cell wall biosynthesis
MKAFRDNMQSRLPPRSADNAAGAHDLPTIYLLDASMAPTGAILCGINIARALAGRAHVVAVLPRDSTIPDAALSDFRSVLRLPITLMKRDPASLALYLPHLVTSSWKILRQMRRDGARTLVVNDFMMMNGAVCRLLGFRGRIFTWIRISPDLFGRLSALWLRAARFGSTRVIAVSRYIRRQLPDGMDAEILYDGIPDDLPAAVRSADPAFVFVGNYHPHKGQHIAVEAFASVLDRHPDASLHFHGGDMGEARNGDYRAQLELRVAELRIDHRVTFSGFARDPRKALEGRYAALNLSRSESFSMTVLEASSCGLPVIATMCGGPEEIVENGVTGILVPRDDPASCAAAMCALCDDPDLAARMGRHGREKSRADFSLAAFERRVRDLLCPGG